MAAILIVIGYFAVILSITMLSMKLVKTKIIRTLFIGLGLLPSIQLIILGILLVELYGQRALKGVHHE